MDPVVSVAVLAYNVFQRKFLPPGPLPRSYVLVMSGIILLIISELNVTLSVFVSPNVILPSNVIVPVARRLPLTSTDLFETTCPVPLGEKLISPFVVVLLTELVLRTIWPLCNLGAATVGVLT